MTKIENRNLRSIARHNRKWSTDEENFMIANISKSVEWLADKLKRQPNSVRQRRAILMADIRGTMMKKEAPSAKEITTSTNGKSKTYVSWETDEIPYVELTMKDVADHVGKFLGRSRTSIHTMRSNINKGEHDEILREAGFFKKEEGGRWLIPKTEENQVREAAKQVAAERHQPDEKKTAIYVASHATIESGQPTKRILW